jgi:hypothetical protein
MTGSLLTLLDQSLDYAGLFPPASLPMAQATATFGHERQGTASILMGRFVCPITRLGELSDAAHTQARQLRVAAILRGGKTAGECLANLEADLASVAAFPGGASDHSSVDTLELKLPPDALAGSALRKLLTAVVALLGRQPGTTRQVFLEVAPTAALEDQLALVAESAGKLRDTTGMALGYKLRTGGSDAASVPAIQLVAAALATARAHRLPMKCTGGLHHPLRGKQAGSDHALHGFINLLAAAAIAHNRSVSSAELEEVLAGEEAGHFTFGRAKLSWGSHSLDMAELGAARNQLLVSFGSCFTDAPKAELRRLGWLK